MFGQLSISTAVGRLCDCEDEGDAGAGVTAVWKRRGGGNRTVGRALAMTQIMIYSCRPLPRSSSTKQACGPLIKASSLPCPPSPHACGPQSKEQSMRCCSLKLRRSPVDTYLHRGMEWGRGGGLGERGWTRACGEGEARGEGGGGRDTGAHTKLASHKRSVQKRLQYRKRYTCTIVVSISLPPLALTTLPPLCPWPQTTSKSRTCPALARGGANIYEGRGEGAGCLYLRRTSMQEPHMPCAEVGRI